MTVSFATQVLSNRVATILKQYGRREVKETARYCDLIDQFFDCKNVRIPKEDKKTYGKPFQKSPLNHWLKIYMDQIWLFNLFWGLESESRCSVTCLAY